METGESASRLRTQKPFSFKTSKVLTRLVTCTRGMYSRAPAAALRTEPVTGQDRSLGRIIP